MTIHFLKFCTVVVLYKLIAPKGSRFCRTTVPQLAFKLSNLRKASTMRTEASKNLTQTNVNLTVYAYRHLQLLTAGQNMCVYRSQTLHAVRLSNLYNLRTNSA